MGKKGGLVHGSIVFGAGAGESSGVNGYPGRGSSLSAPVWHLQIEISWNLDEISKTQMVFCFTMLHNRETSYPKAKINDRCIALVFAISVNLKDQNEDVVYGRWRPFELVLNLGRAPG